MGIGFLFVGFIKGYFTEFKTAFKGSKAFFAAMGKDLKGIWNFGKNWLKGTNFGKWLGSIKGFFVSTIDKSLSMRHHTKIMNESGIMKVYKSITKWFGKKIPFKLPKFPI